MFAEPCQALLHPLCQIRVVVEAVQQSFYSPCCYVKAVKSPSIHPKAVTMLHVRCDEERAECSRSRASRFSTLSAKKPVYYTFYYTKPIYYTIHYTKSNLLQKKTNLLRGLEV